jgi:hypothetical protein
MREVHARCVKISRNSVWCRKPFCGFASISVKISIGIISAKEFLEIRLTADAIRVEFANCPGRKNKN